jgi:hypothetical protein
VGGRGWDWVTYIVHPRKRSNLGVEQCCSDDLDESNVTPRIVVPLGRSSFMNNTSSCASAPSSEWPIYVESRNAICAPFLADPMVIVKTNIDDMSWSSPTRQSLDFCEDFGTLFSFFLRSIAKPGWTQTTLGTSGIRMEWTFCRVFSVAQTGIRIV